MLFRRRLRRHLFAKPDETSKSPSGAKNWRRVCLRQARAVLRPSRLATSRRAMTATNDSTPHRLPCVLSTPALTCGLRQNPRLLRLLGGRRTSCAPSLQRSHVHNESHCSGRSGLHLLSDAAMAKNFKTCTHLLVPCSSQLPFLGCRVRS